MMFFEIIQFWELLVEVLRQFQDRFRNLLHVLIAILAGRHQPLNNMTVDHLLVLQLLAYFESDVYGSDRHERWLVLAEGLVVKCHLGEVHTHLLEHEVLDDISTTLM